MICGHCAIGAHHDCNGFLRTDHAFCPCADRGHVERTEEQQRIAEQNEAIYLNAVATWFRRQEAAR